LTIISNSMVAMPATLWARIKAFALDYIVIAGYLLLVVALGVWMNYAGPVFIQTLFTNRITGQIVSFLLVTLPVTLYFTLFEASLWQGTWGKHKIGLRVTGTDGARVSVPHALGRTLLKFIPWELSHTSIWQLQFVPPESSPMISTGFVFVWVLIGANLLSLVLSKTHQTLYDRLARTYVVVG
jgi:uncharacterized RDD family membrane protein YckC